MLPDSVIARVERRLGCTVARHASVGGGCIANAMRLFTDRGDFFLKWSFDDAAATFPSEAEGLRALRAAGSTLVVPEPLFACASDGGEPGMLILEWIRPGERHDGFWDQFARALAGLHRHTDQRYGFGTDNFIGRLPQENTWEAHWSTFFFRRRIEPQVRMARAGGKWRHSWNTAIERIGARLSSYLPEYPDASTLHGDLWGGNFMVAEGGRPAIFDPAVYYGHREVDLAMAGLFGGFDARFFDAYRDAWPLEPGYEDRRELYNLYHLINHLNHFGAGYAESVARILRRF